MGQVTAGDAQNQGVSGKQPVKMEETESHPYTVLLTPARPTPHYPKKKRRVSSVSFGYILLVTAKGLEERWLASLGK